MTARSVILDPALDRFLTEQVASGAYRDSEAVLAAGVERLRRDQQEDATKRARFQALIQEGVDEMETGRFETVDDIGAWLDGLGPTPLA